MNRQKPFNRPPKTGNYLGWLELTVEPIENEPDPAKMIEVSPGPPPIELTVKPIENEPDPAKMIEVFMDGSKHLIFEVSPNGSGKSLPPPVEPTSVGSDS